MEPFGKRTGRSFNYGRWDLDGIADKCGQFAVRHHFDGRAAAGGNHDRYGEPGRIGTFKQRGIAECRHFCGLFLHFPGFGRRCSLYVYQYRNFAGRADSGWERCAFRFADDIGSIQFSGHGGRRQRREVDGVLFVDRGGSNAYRDPIRLIADGCEFGRSLFDGAERERRKSPLYLGVNQRSAAGWLVVKVERDDQRHAVDSGDV